MARPPPQQRMGKRRVDYEDWMEEDDLLGEDASQGRDLRHRLHSRDGSSRMADPPRWGQEGDRRPMNRDEYQGGQRQFHQRSQGDSRGEFRFPQRGGRGGRQVYQPRQQNYQGGNRVQGEVTPREEDHRYQRDQRAEQQKGKGYNQAKSEVCYKCKKVGHMAAECEGVHQKKLKMYGFGVAGQGFYSIEIPENKATESFNATLLILEGNASESKLDNELKNLVNATWDFHVRQATNGEFRAAFPDQGSIDTLSKLSEIKLALYGIKVKIISSKIDPSATTVLQTTWIKIYGIPDFAREEDVIREIASLAGEPIKIDDFSLSRDEPVRVRINCRNPADINGYIEIFFNGVGREIRYVAEGSTGRRLPKGGGPPGPGKKDDKQGKDNGRKEDEDMNRKKPHKSGRSDEYNDKETDLSQDSQEDCMEDLVTNESPPRGSNSLVLDQFPLAAFHPTIGMIHLQENLEMNCPALEPNIQQTNDTQQSESQMKKNLEVLPVMDNEVDSNGQNSQESVILSLEKSKGEKGKTTDKIVVHSLEGTYLMDKDKWPVLKLPEEQAHSEEDMLDNTSNFSLEVITEEEDNQGWMEAQDRRKKIKLSKKMKKPVVATRSSTRVVRDGVPIAVKAMTRTRDKNELKKEMETSTEEGRRLATC
ncbi:unnamed protein product [Urochloa decumbens]|uniref:CCHC-type domain-containing protein n=1 Tax=Urochloa decumbens TaxID=240449 RepID=A0ABC8XZY0_9POAL